MKPKYVALIVQESVLVNGQTHKLAPGNSVGMCPVYSSKAQAKKDFPNTELIKIERVEK